MISTLPLFSSLRWCGSSVLTRGMGICSNDEAMDWKPYVVCAPQESAPRARGMNAPEGLGDRLRTAAFAERQAAEAFTWAADRFVEAPGALRAAWRELAVE